MVVVVGVVVGRGMVVVRRARATLHSRRRGQGPAREARAAGGGLTVRAEAAGPAAASTASTLPLPIDALTNEKK